LTSKVDFLLDILDMADRPTITLSIHRKVAFLDMEDRDTRLMYIRLLICTPDTLRLRMATDTPAILRNNKPIPRKSRKKKRVERVLHVPVESRLQHAAGLNCWETWR
jgi:hypothetical protein